MDLISFIKYVDIIIKWRRNILSIIFGFIVFSIIYVFLTPVYFVSVTTIIPEVKPVDSSLRELSSIALQLSGSNMMNDDLTQFYEPILKSRRIIESILKTEFYSSEKKIRISLLDLMEIEGDNLDERLYYGYKILNDEVLEIVVDQESKITRIRIETKEPKLSAEVANEFVKQLDIYFRESSSSRAKENKDFIISRLEETFAQLREAEEELKIFNENNMRIEKSPELLIEKGRKLREVRIQEEVYLTLKKELELTKIEEVKSIPWIRVLDEAIPAIKKSRPNRRVIVLVMAFLGTVFGLVISFVNEYVGQYIMQPTISVKINKWRTLINKDFKAINKGFQFTKKRFSRNK